MGTSTKIVTTALIGLALSLAGCDKAEQTKDDETPKEAPTTATQPDEQPDEQPADPAEQADAGQADMPAKIVSGEEIYGHVCVTCHGKTGDGKGLDQELFSYGAPEAKWTNGPTVDGIQKTLTQGVHATSMKPFPQYGEAERIAVAQYVLELREKLQKAEQTE